MQLTGLFASHAAKSATGHIARQMAGDMDDNAIQDLYLSTMYAKLAFLSPKLGPSAPDTSYLKQALDSAEDLEYAQPDSPGIARRVIILRLLLHRPAFTAITRKGDPKGVKPVDSFTVNLPKEISAADKLKYNAEITAWIAADSGSKMAPAQVAQVVKTISTIPGIGWWKSPGLVAIYASQKDNSRVESAFTTAKNDAVASFMPLILAVPVILCMALVGIFLLVFLLARAGSDPSQQPTGFNPWPTVPSPIRDIDRKLDTNFLWGIFAFYLFMNVAVSVVLSGFSGTGLFQWLHFNGLLTSHINAIRHLSSANHMLITVIITAIAYLVVALVPMFVLIVVARKRKASLADELGWHARNIKRNILFGVLGYCTGLPLLFAAGLVGKSVFKGAPEPTNPAITLLTNSSSTAAQMIMVAVAVIAAPLLEEFFFRGVFYQGARQKFGPLPAILMTGAVFGLVHPVGLAGMFTIAVLGCVLAWIAESRKALASSMVGHFMQNIGASMAVILLVSR